MVTKNFILKCLYVGIILIFCFCSDIFSSMELPEDPEQSPLKLKLSLKKLNLTTKEVLVQLVVTNTGERRLTLPHLTEELLKHYFTWGGWVLIIKNQDKQLLGYGLMRSPRFQEKELLELESGEHFTVTINLADARRMPLSAEDYDSFHPKLVNVNGEYEVKARLSLGNHNIPRNLKNVVWKGKVESNTITFMIHRREQYLPRRLHFPIGREDGWVCHCRADCDGAISNNPCRQKPLEEQSQTAIAFGSSYVAARETAREHARDQLRGILLAQPCFCTGPGGKQRIDY